MLETNLDVDINQTALVEIKQCFDNGLPIVLELPEYPNRLVKILSSGRVEELAIDKQGNLISTLVLDENFQRINEELKNLSR